PGRQQGHAGQHPQRRPADGAGLPGPGGKRGVARLRTRLPEQRSSVRMNVMETPAPAKPVKIKRLLPYWAVFQADLKQTFRSWIYRVWVFLSLGAALGYLLYRYGAEQVAGIMQQGSELVSDILSWIMLGSVTLIVVLTAGTICSERGNMA